MLHARRGLLDRMIFDPERLPIERPPVSSL
jgi:hypothetical protein